MTEEAERDSLQGSVSNWAAGARRSLKLDCFDCNGIQVIDVMAE